MPVMNKKQNGGFARICSEYFGLSRTLSLVVMGVVASLCCLAIFWFIYSAPPRVITLTSGPAGSPFEANAVKYRAFLEKKGMKLSILPSQGSLENLERLENPRYPVDVGFVQGGLAGTNTDGLVSLGSISYEPLLIFYRSETPVTRLAQLAGKRLAVGAEGSGTRFLALALLQTNGIVPGGSTTLEALDAGEAADALLAGRVDAAFLTSDSASSQTMRLLLRSSSVRLMSFEQADAYTRKFIYLNKLHFPEGSIDFSNNLPAADVWLVGPTVELVARPHLNSALVDLLMEAAQDTHGHASIFQNQGEFPALVQHEFTLSDEARRYYKSGKTFLYNLLPFWIASLIHRVTVAFVPLLLVLIPGLRLIPAAYKWQSQLRIRRWYRKLLALERELAPGITQVKQAEMLGRLHEIEAVVLEMRVPASFGDQFYGLRQHIDYVREKLSKAEHFKSSAGITPVR
jgi:TRAP-type uncharacterized transport system substrate-binding protein